MRIAARILFVVSLATLLPACEKWSWPPYQKSLRDLFVENQGQFEEIRDNMVADNLESVTSADAKGRGFRCAGTDCPRTIGEHDELLQEKYSKLIEEGGVFRYTLHDGEFNISGLPFPPTQGGDFDFAFVWSEKGPLVPRCDEGKARLPSCGACYENLDPNWYMYWRWFPQDLGPDWDGSIGEGSPTMEEINEQREMAVVECLKAGRVEMERDSSTK